MIDKLLDTKDKAFYMFRPETKEKLAHSLIAFINENAEKYDGLIDYDYESLFLGNKKQLLVYKSVQSVKCFLRKYRLPGNYAKMKDNVNKIEDGIDKLVIERNIQISLDKPLVDIDAITD